MLDILLVEDNEDLCELIVSKLEQNNYKVDFAHDGEVALSLFDNKHYDLIITDIMMPKVDGIELIKYIRSLNLEIPILIITAKTTQNDKYIGFNAGTDDYMIKPIDMDELVFRVNALLRRAKINNDRKLIIGNAILDYDQCSISIDDKISVLPPKEFLILFKLLSSPNKIFTKNEIMTEFWGINSDSDEMTVYTHIHRLREKFSDCPYFEIVTIKNLGYKAIVK